ncbi:MAG TPA: antibiotic biosynthesis monooxygenase [Pirellulaceae bacterium]|nr:antibiotic biosynthesis monooxygenase [Pirellulaceae bacterium]
MMVVIFRSRLRTEHANEYVEMAQKIDALAERMPGFLGIKSYATSDGERVSISLFASPEALAAWREHPEHREAQRLGRERFYSEYHIEVCQLERAYHFPAEQ